MKLVFLDLDGTLLTEGKLVEESLKILDDLSASGHKFCIATGRQLELVKDLGLFEGREGYFILENGCVVGFAKDNEFQVFNDWEENIAPYIDEMRMLASELGKQHYIIQKERGFSIETYDDIEIPEEFPNARVLRNCDTLDFMPKIAGKKHAAVFLMRKLDLDKDSVVHVGDSMNDYDLLDLVGICGTVDNADPAVKKLVMSKGGFISNHQETKGVRAVLSALGIL